MTDNEWVILALGSMAGSQLTAALYIALDVRASTLAARRSQAEADRVRRRTGGDLYMNSFRLYQLQRRGPA